MSAAVCAVCVFCALLSVTSGASPLIEDRWGLRTIVGTITVVLCLLAVPVPWTWL